MVIIEDIVIISPHILVEVFHSQEVGLELELVPHKLAELWEGVVACIIHPHCR